jgi:hypothetical protein
MSGMRSVMADSKPSAGSHTSNMLLRVCSSLQQPTPQPSQE